MKKPVDTPSISTIMKSSIGLGLIVPACFIPDTAPLSVFSGPRGEQLFYEIGVDVGQGTYYVEGVEGIKPKEPRR